MPTKTYEPLVVYHDGDPDQFRKLSQVRKCWRPTVTMLVHCNGHYLVTKHLVRREKANGRFEFKEKPDIPKGGVDECDGRVIDGVYRELLEEVCLKRTHVRQVNYLGHVLVPFDQHNVGRDGYTEGKWYFLYHVDISCQKVVAPGLEHGITHVYWEKDIASHFARPGKKPTKKFRIFSSESFQMLLKRQERRLVA